VGQPQGGGKADLLPVLRPPARPRPRIPKEVLRVVTLFVQLSTLLDRTKVELDAPAALKKNDLLHIPLDGERTASWPAIDRLVKLYVEGKESVFYKRQPANLSVCTVTTHRITHRPSSILLTGPAYVSSQWRLEGLFADFAAKRRSLVHAVPEMQNLGKTHVVATAIRLKYGLDDPPPPPTSPHATSTLLPDTALLPPHLKTEKLVLTSTEEEDLGDWERERVVVRTGAVLKKWGKAKLSNGAMVGSKWAEVERKEVREGEEGGKGKGKGKISKRIVQVSPVSSL
jgi:hypothetical protein